MYLKKSNRNILNKSAKNLIREAKKQSSGFNKKKAKKKR